MVKLNSSFRTTTSPFEEMADSLLEAGYTVIPIMPRNKVPGTYAGHWSAMDGWNDFARKRPATAMIDRWKTWPEANIGVVLGTPAGAYQLIAIDLDTDDENELDMLQSQIPVSPMQKRGQRGYTAFYRAGVGVKTKRYMVAAPTPDKPNAKRTLLEVLTGNAPRQTVMPPSMHPCGREYQWTNEIGIVPIARLPILTEEHFEQLEDTLEHLGWNGQVEAPNRNEPATQLGDDDPNVWRQTNNLALQNLDAWVSFLGLPKLKRHGNGSWEGVPFWRPSGTGQSTDKRKPNLKFHVSGIKDMGTDEGYTPLDVVQTAFAWDFDTCFSWLRGKIGLGDSEIALRAPVMLARDESGNLYNQETGEIVHAVAGEDPPVDDEELPAPIDDDVEVVETIRPASSGKGKVGGPSEGRTPKSEELPDHLTRPPGLLGDLTDWIESTANTPNRVIAFGSALTAIGTLVGRKYCSPTQSGTALYVLCLGLSGCGKQHGLDSLQRVLRDSKAESTIGSPEAMSSTALVKQLREQPLSCSGVDEFAQYMKRINSKRAASHEEGIKKVMLQAWGANFNAYQTPSWANVASETVFAPCFSMLAMSTPASFYAALEGSDIENGMLNRFLVLKTDVVNKQRVRGRASRDMPDDLKDNLCRLFLYDEGAFPDPLRQTHDWEITPIALKWSDAVGEAYTSYTDEIHNVCNTNSTLAPFFARTAEMGLRIATIQALARDPEALEISMEDLEYGKEIAKWSAYSMARQARLYMSETANQAETNRIIQIIKKCGGSIEHTDLLRRLKHRQRAKDVKDHIASLKESGTLTVGRETPKDGGTPKTIYILQKQD